MSISENKQPADLAGEQKYRAFLLRCWQEEATDPDGRPAWRFTLVHFDGKQTRKGFASLKELVAYLRAELDIANVAGRRGRKVQSKRQRRGKDARETQSPESGVTDVA